MAKSKKSKKASKKASTGMTKTAIIAKVAEKCAVKTKEVKEILDAFTTAGYAELKKTGSFRIKGWCKCV
eukprot:gene7647-17879_t